MARIVNRIVIARPIEAVFDYVTTPAFWPLWHPSTVAVLGKTDESLGLKDQVIEEVLIMGLRDRTRWTVDECDRPRKWSVVARRTGGVHARLTYRLQGADSGTLLEGEFSYQMPGILLNAMAHLLIRHRIDSESREAVERLKALLETTGEGP